MTGAAAAVLWLLAAWRWWQQTRRPYPGTWAHRSLTEGAAWLAATVSILALSDYFATWLGVHNLRALLLRYTIGLAFLRVRRFLMVLLYKPAVTAQWMVRSATVCRWATAAMMTDATILWWWFVPHDHDLAMLNVLPGTWATVLIVGQYLWLLVVSLDALIASGQAARDAKLDLGTRVSATLIALTATIGVVAALEMGGARLLRPGSLQVPSMDWLCPLAGAFFAASLVTAPVLEMAQVHWTAHRMIRELRPQWLDATARCPEVVLPMSRSQRWIDAPMVAERMRIELLDARAIIARR